MSMCNSMGAKLDLFQQTSKHFRVIFSFESYGLLNKAIKQHFLNLDERFFVLCPIFFPHICI